MRRSKKTSTLRATGLMTGINRWPVVSLRKDQERGKCFHLMTSSCLHLKMLGDQWQSDDYAELNMNISIWFNIKTFITFFPMWRYLLTGLVLWTPELFHACASGHRIPFRTNYTHIRVTGTMPAVLVITICNIPKIAGSCKNIRYIRCVFSIVLTRNI